MALRICVLFCDMCCGLRCCVLRGVCVCCVLCIVYHVFYNSSNGFLSVYGLIGNFCSESKAFLNLHLPEELTSAQLQKLWKTKATLAFGLLVP